MLPPLTLLLSLLLAALGAAAVVLGEADDSPGLQGIGLLLVLGAVTLVVRTARRGRTPDRRPAAEPPPT